MATELFITHATSDAAAGARLEAAVTPALARQGVLQPQDQPALRRVDYAALPDIGAIDAISLVLLILPAAGTPFEAGIREKLDAYVAPGATHQGQRLITICIESGRERCAAPLTGHVAMHIHGMLDSEIDDVVTRALLEMNLRITRNAGIFISYRQLDGRRMVERLAKELTARHFKVWWDEGRDDNGLLKITGEAQKTIERAIETHGFVLLIDTPLAAESVWVQEEVNIGWGKLMLPIVPVVVAPNPRAPVSRFRAVAAARSVMLERGFDSTTPDDDVRTAVDAIENTILVEMKEHAQSRRRLLAQTEKAFQSLQYQWKEHTRQELLYAAEATLHSDVTPGMKLRLLVQCSPYARVEPAQIARLNERLKEEGVHHYQFAVFMHNAAVSSTERAQLLRGLPHLLLLDSTQIPRIFTDLGISVSR